MLFNQQYNACIRQEKGKVLSKPRSFSFEKQILRSLRPTYSTPMPSLRMPSALPIFILAVQISILTVQKNLPVQKNLAVQKNFDRPKKNLDVQKKF